MQQEENEEVINNEEEQQEEENEENQEEQYEDEEEQGQEDENENEQVEGEEKEDQENEAENEANSHQNTNQAQMININMQRNAQIPPHISSATGVQIQNSNLNLNQENMVNSQIQINNGNFNQINIQKQQQIIQQGPEAPPDVVFPDPQYNSNIVRNAQLGQNMQMTSSIKNDQNQNRDPMMYSFGAKSAESLRSNIANSGNKNMAGSENDFLQSSLTNQNNMNGAQQGGMAMGMGNSGIITGSNIVTSSRITADFGGQSQEKISSPRQMEGSQRELREPGDSKKKSEEEDEKEEDINDIAFGPRDSRKKN